MVARIVPSVRGGCMVLPLGLLCPLLHPAAAEEPVWTLVFRQTTTEGKAVWQSMDDWRSYGSSDTDANYSVLDHLDELLGPDKLYHLKLLYPLSHKGQSNEWTQTQSPLKSEGKNAKIAGYTAIHCDWTNGPFIGLQLCSDAADDKSTLLCSQNNRGNWWYAIGVPKTFQKDHGNIPGPKSDVVQQVELWMLGVPPLIPLTVHAGVPFIVLVAVTMALYVGAGVPIGARRSGKPLGLGAHPHFVQWCELLGLAKDGVAFVAGAPGRGRPRQLGLQSGAPAARSRDDEGSLLQAVRSREGAIDGSALLHAEDSAVVGRPPKHRTDKRLSKRERQRQIEASDARVARMLAQEQARTQSPGATGAGVEEVLDSRGRHQSQAMVRVRGLGGGDDYDDEGLDLNLD